MHTRECEGVNVTSVSQVLRGYYFPQLSPSDLPLEGVWGIRLTNPPLLKKHIRKWVRRMGCVEACSLSLTVFGSIPEGRLFDQPHTHAAVMETIRPPCSLYWCKNRSKGPEKNKKGNYSSLFGSGLDHSS